MAWKRGIKSSQSVRRVVFIGKSMVEFRPAGLTPVEQHIILLKLSELMDNMPVLESKRIRNRMIGLSS